MGKVLLAGILTLAASASLGQTESTSDQATGGPANLCQELLAFMQAPPPERTGAAAKPKQEGVAANAPSASGQASPQSSEKGSSSQEVSGQAGPAHESPDPKAKPVEGGTAQNAPQKSGVSAPVPTDATSTPKDSVLSIAEAAKLAEANDTAACQAAAKELRLAGVAMPPPLLALAALDLRYQSTAGPQALAPEAGEAAAPKTQGN